MCSTDYNYLVNSYVFECHFKGRRQIQIVELSGNFAVEEWHSYSISYDSIEYDDGDNIDDNIEFTLCGHNVANYCK